MACFQNAGRSKEVRIVVMHEFREGEVAIVQDTGYIIICRLLPHGHMKAGHELQEHAE